MSNLKLAVIGCGYWGKNLVRNFYELGVLSSICDLNKDILELSNKQYSKINFTTSFKEVLNNDKIDAVAIATPSATHYTLVKEALNRNKDVFVEKPLSLRAKDAQDLIRLAKKRDKILMVGHILQYHPAVDKLKGLIGSGDLGKIQYIYSNRLNIGRLRTEENILWSFAPHDISVILSLVNEEPKNIYAFGEAYLQKGINDVTLTILDFKSRIKAHIFVSWLHPFKEHRLIIVGSKKMAVFEDTNLQEKLVVYPHIIEWKVGKIPVARKAEKEVINIKQGEPLKIECKHFLECVKKRTKPKTDGEEGLRVLKVLEAAEKSLQRN